MKRRRPEPAIPGDKGIFHVQPGAAGRLIGWTTEKGGHIEFFN